MITKADLPDHLCRGLTTTAKHSTIEVCGFILDDFSYHVIDNVSPRPETTFFMDPVKQVEFLMEHKDEVIGVWHSHPTKEPEPTDSDIKGWHPAMPWRYFVVSPFEVREFERQEDGTVKCVFKYTRRG